MKQGNKQVEREYKKSVPKRTNLVMVLLILTVFTGIIIYNGYYITENPNSGHRIDVTQPDFSNIITNLTNTNITPSLSEDDKDTKNEKNPVNEFIKNITSIFKTNEPTYEDLVEYALLQVNIERHDRGVQNVSLGNNSCAQNHAENMLKYGYLSHWDTNGLKPYMRYTLEGGKALVSENCAWMSSTNIEPYQAIHDLNWGMIYDDADSNWGHRDNLLDPNHNKVNIGVAWDNSNLYLVQDFEDDYFTQSIVSRHQNVVRMEYHANIPTWNISKIGIYFDQPLHNLTVSELSRFPYHSSYSQGTFIGGVVPMGHYFEGAVTINTGDWDLFYNGSQTSFSSSFDLTIAFNKYGTGVYTLIIWGEEGPYTAISIWN